MSKQRQEQPKKGRGIRLSKAEIAGIPIIIVLVLWIAYSVAQPAVSTSLTTASTLSASKTGGAPDFTLSEIGSSGPTGKTITLSSFRGKIVMLEFMEPWCPHCQSMQPTMNNLQDKFGNVVFINIAGPWNGVTTKDITDFINTYSAKGRFVFDSSGGVMNLYGVSSTPTYFLIGQDGSVIRSYQGEQPYNTFAADLTTIGA